MKGDFSRRTHDPRKHYSAVLQQQGRLLTDADLEEEHRILSDQLETTAADVIGGCGAPIGAAGFHVTANGTNLLLSAGRFYADGMLLRNETAVNYLNQPDRFPEPGSWPPPPGRYAIYLDTWRRLITELDDPSIREVALGGPTTSVREKTVWQARHVAVPANWHCGLGLPGQPQATGSMAAQAEPEAALSTPCLVPPLAGYTGLENQLYRVEVFGPGAALNLANPPLFPVVTIPAGATNQVTLSAANANQLADGDAVEVVRTGQNSDPLDATFAHVAAKPGGGTITLTSRLPDFAPNETLALRRVQATVVVSRENGSVVTAIERISGREVTVESLGPDDVLGFAPGQWVELSDDRVELEPRAAGQPQLRQLRQIEAIDTDRQVVTLRTAATNLANNADGVLPGRHPKLRRWDAARGVVFRADGSAWLHLENGIQVRFTAGDYLSGDYWQFPARAAIIDAASGNIEWPRQGNAPALLKPFGIEHHLCPLAAVQVTQAAGGTTVAVIADCRDLFPPVTELTNLLYVGGDGQEAKAQAAGGEATLPAPLTVRVANGSHPVQGALVRFQVTTGAGTLIGGPDVPTDANGLASVQWSINLGQPEHSCVANLLDSSASAIAHQVVQFHATVDRDSDDGGSRCCCVSVGKGGDFTRIEEAIEVLTSRGERDICLCLIPGDHEVGQLELKQPDLGRPMHLSISGCGRGTRVHTEGGIIIDRWQSVRFSAFDLNLRGQATMLAVGVDEVTLDDIHARGNPPKVGLVRLHDSARVQVSGCVLVARSREQEERGRELVAGLGPLEGAFAIDDERDLDRAIRRAAGELDSLSVGDRRALAKELTTRIADRGKEFSAGAKAAVRRLAEQIAQRRDPAATAAAISDFKAAVARQSDMVALEIGASDELQEKIADPSAVTTATVHVESNDIVGNISFYGAAGGRVLDEGARKQLEERLKGQVLFPVGLAGTVHLRDNRFAHLLISSGMQEAIRQVALGGIAQLPTLYESFHVTNNVVDGIGGQAAALHAVLTSNDFTLAAIDQAAPPVLLMTLVAETAIYTGNHGALAQAPTGAFVAAQIEQSVRNSAVAANLELNIV